MRVYLIEDDEAVGAAVARMLRTFGAEVRSFVRVAEAVQVARETPPDVFISDYWLTGRIDGIDAISAVRKVHAGVKTLLLSGVEPETKIRDALSKGIIDRFIQKPWDYHELKGAVRELAVETL